MRRNEKVSCDYDEKSDVLYISFGKPKEAICIEKEAGVFLRVDPLKDKIVGITILNLRSGIIGKGNDTQTETKQICFSGT